MSNMSYCRFRNTLPDLEDCYENMFEGKELELNPEEAKARKRIIKICRDIVEDADFNDE